MSEGDVAVERAPSQQEDNKETSVQNTEKDKAEEKRRQYFQEELRRLQKGLQKESARIKDPGQREHIPYVFNSLVPYYETRLAEEVIDKDQDKPDRYQSRNTAIGLVDPWVSHKMDCELLPETMIKEPSAFKKDPKKAKKQGYGSTIIPNFPTVKMETKDLETKQLVYSDVPMLREELRQKYSSQAHDKIQQDYEHTKNDFYRMELHKLDQVHPQSRGNMRKTYFAYLQNSPGSKKALKECVKGLAGSQEGKKSADDQEEKKDGEEEKEAEKGTEKGTEKETEKEADKESSPAAEEEKPEEQKDQVTEETAEGKEGDGE